MTQPSHRCEITYRCVVGHDVATSELDRLTIITNLDRGAEVRICREHGAPIAQTIRPIHHPDGHE